MKTFIVNAASEDQETAIRLFLDDLHVEYDTADELDETAYLLSSTANAGHLKKSIEQGRKGDTTSISLDDIWKE